MYHTPNNPRFLVVEGEDNRTDFFKATADPGLSVKGVVGASEAFESLPV
jgi:hypothetical protein